MQQASPRGTAGVGAPAVRAPGHPWPRSVVWLHWLTLLPLLVALGAAMWRSQIDERSLRALLMAVHQWAGAATLVLVVARLVERARAGRLPAPQSRRLPRVAAAIVHSLLYLALLAVPLLGWALTSALDKPPPWGLLLPGIGADDEALADDLGVWHPVAAGLLLLLLGLHVAAALWHHWVLRDDVLRAMTPAGAARQAAPPAMPPRSAG